MGPCLSFSYAVGNQGHRSVSQGREGGRRQGSSDKGTKANHLVSELPAGLPLSIVCCWEDAGPGLGPGVVNDGVRNKSSEDASCWRACGGSFFFFFSLHNEQLILAWRFGKGEITGRKETDESCLPGKWSWARRVPPLSPSQSRGLIVGGLRGYSMTIHRVTFPGKP